jgi:hypothetical protein
VLRPIAVKPWTPEEDDALVAMANLPVREQARKLDRTHQAVANRRESLRATGRIAPQRVYRSWTADEVRILVDTFGQPAEAVALRLGRSVGAVENKRRLLRERLRAGKDASSI